MFEFMYYKNCLDFTFVAKGFYDYLPQAWRELFIIPTLILYLFVFRVSNLVWPVLPCKERA